VQILLLEDTFGSRTYGCFLMADGGCTGCGRCVRDCQAGNIRMDSGHPRLLKISAIKGGYDIDRMFTPAPGEPAPNLDRYPHHRRYLEEHGEL
jgi:ferredoxin